MDYTQIINKNLTELGFDIVPVYNCFDIGYDPVRGWPMKMPDVEFGPRTLLVLHFQDFVTPGFPVLELSKVEQHYGQHADQVLVTYWSHGMDYGYTGPVNLIEFSNHNMTTCVSIAGRYQEWSKHFEQPRDLAWQCLNGRMCSHRLRAADLLRNWAGGTLSYGDQILLPEWAYSTYRGTENDENFARLAPLYARTKVNIVTETLYDARPGIVSEKTLMAMIARQIPIVIGHPGIVQDCRELGFDMFEDVVDTSYDWLPNDQRVEQALLRNQDLILGKIDLDPYQERLEAQQKFVLDDYATIIELRFARDCKKLAQSIIR